MGEHARHLGGAMRLPVVSSHDITASARRFFVAFLTVALLTGVAARSDAGINSWTPTGPDGGRIRVLVADPNAPATVYAGTDESGVFKTTDGGTSWAAVNTGFAGFVSVSAMAVDPATAETAYVATGDGVFKTTNGGSSWSLANVGLESVPAATQLVVAPAAPATIYAGSFGQGVFKSVDG